MKVLLLAGEESGLIYARGLAARLRARDASVEIRGYSDYGFETHDLAVIGVVPVLLRLFYFLRVKRTLRRAIDAWRPDVVLTVDYPGMNLRLAAYAKSRGIRAVHVVCPQVWAWKQGRIPKIEAALDALCCFFPFEPKLFRPGFARFVGHPLARAFASLRATRGDATRGGAGEALVALLPGSRRGEIARILPVMLAAAEKVPHARFEIPAANPAARRLIDRLAGGRARITVRDGGARELLLAADCAAVASGTATLEATLARCPTVLVYKVGAVFAWLARRLVTGTRFLGLANVIWERCGGTGAQPMEELLQEAFTPEALAERLNAWVRDAAARDAASRRLDAVDRLLATEGDPLARIAETACGGAPSAADRSVAEP